jgi:hypothetical protein
LANMPGRQIAAHSICRRLRQAERNLSNPRKVEVLFEQELRRRGLSFRIDPESGRYVVPWDGLNLHIALDNLERTLAESEDDSCVPEFAEVVFKPREILSWQTASARIFELLESNDHQEAPPFRSPLSPRLDRVLALWEEGGTARWVFPEMLDEWGVDLEAVRSAAGENLATTLARAEIGWKDHHGARLGYFGTPLPCKAALMTAANLKQIAAPTLGWPLLAVIPAQDFLLLWDASRRDFLSELAALVVDQFTRSAYPLTTEVFEISDQGISAIGDFPVSR